MLHYLGSLPRRARWALQRWTSSADLAFHDALFAAQGYDPFTFAYPGYLTIRRFADLAGEHLPGLRRAVDLGCGPGEITCEMARRWPGVQFTGVDHSSAAIARATAHASALGLANAAFRVADVAAWDADPPPDIVLMFDAFHHVLDPAAFVRRMRTDRFFLIEPGGDWLGGWARTLDFDWIVPALDTIRARVAWQLGATPEAAVPGPGASGPESSVDTAGAPVEHRYTMPDFQRFFEGFGLTVRGTIAGVERYPPDPYGRVPLRDPFGRVAYDAIVAIEARLAAADLDLHAKHWAIYAERGAASVLRTPRPVGPASSAPPAQLEGPYDVEFLGCDGSVSAPPGSTLVATVSFRNRSWRPWSSAAGVCLSYHWLAADGTVAVEDGLRTPLPRTVQPNDVCAMSCRIETPSSPGRYTLAFDLVEEGVTWFSRAGAPLLKVPFQVSAAGR